MHAAEMMARLNPATVRYDIGRGGMPELTPQDIAAALGMVPKGLGRELMCRLWWPEGARLSAQELDHLLMEVQLAEWMRRADALVDAQLKAEVAKNDHMRRRAARSVEEAQANLWPRVGPGSPYASIRTAVLSEMSAACLCPACRGRGLLVAEKQVVACKFCETSGRAKVSDRNRAELVGVNRETYRRAVASPYEWLLEHCTQALEPARTAFERKLR